MTFLEFFGKLIPKNSKKKNSKKIPKKIPKKFQKNSKKNSKKIPKNSKKFQKKFQKIPKTLQCCKTKYLEKQVKQISTKCAIFAEVVVALERQYPCYETHLSIRTEIQSPAMLPNNPNAARISQLLANLNHWVGQLTPGSYGSDQMLFWSVAEIPRDVWDECRPTAERKARTLTYQDLSLLLLELELEKEGDQHLNAYRPGGGNSGNHGRGHQGPTPGQGTTPKNARYMGNVQDVFWCDATNEQGGLVHAPAWE